MSDFIQNAVNNLYRDNELAALKAEVARLKAQIDAKMEVGVPYADYERLFAENARLKAEVERLTKAGDAMAEELIQEYGREVCLKFGWFKGWNAAKEGKQS